MEGNANLDCVFVGILDALRGKAPECRVGFTTRLRGVQNRLDGTKPVFGFSEYKSAINSRT